MRDPLSVGVSWVLVGVGWGQLGVSWEPDVDPFGDCDPSQATMFPPRDGPKTLELGQTKARNGFGSLKIGGHHVDMVGWPSVGLVGYRLGSVVGPTDTPIDPTDS